MGRKKPLKYRTLRKTLKRFGIEESKQRGKGSERMFVGVVNGRRVTYPTKCHGEGDEKPIPVIEAIRRAFSIDEAHGVSDEAFYGT
jgi:predicted RNA binding protein YcfA (HicA-like mRNA interferase family)